MEMAVKLELQHLLAQVSSIYKMRESGFPHELLNFHRALRCAKHTPLDTQEQHDGKHLGIRSRPNHMLHASCEKLRALRKLVCRGGDMLRNSAKKHGAPEQASASNGSENRNNSATPGLPERNPHKHQLHRLLPSPHNS